MGNLEKELSALPYATSKWRQTNTPHILVEVQSGIKAQHFRVDALSKEDARMSMFRSIYKQCIVEIFAILDQSEASRLIVNNKLVNKSSGIHVMVEHIEYRLSDLGALSLQDGAYILSQGLKASKALATIFKNFQFDLDTIGINQRGKCKFWINSNFHNNAVENLIPQDSKQRKYTNQNSMIFDYQYCCNMMGNLCERSGTKFQNKSSIKSYINLVKTLTNLIDLIEAQMLLGIASQERKSYEYLKKKHLRSTSLTKQSHEQNRVQQIQQFIVALSRLANIQSTYSINLPSTNSDNILSKASQYGLDRLTTQISEYDYYYDSRVIKKFKQLKHKQTSSKKSLKNQNVSKTPKMNKSNKAQNQQQLTSFNTIYSKFHIIKTKQTCNLSSSNNETSEIKQKSHNKITHIAKANRVRRKASQPELYCGQRINIETENNFSRTQNSKDILSSAQRQMMSGIKDNIPNDISQHQIKYGGKLNTTLYQQKSGVISLKYQQTSLI